LLLGKVSREAILRIVRHLPQQQDLALIVLKGHLLVEQQMRDIARLRAVDTEVDKIAGLKFWSLTRVVRALVNDGVPNSWWEAIDALNKLRNELAHKLESPGIEMCWPAAF